MDQLQDQSLTQSEVVNPMQLVDWRNQLSSEHRQRIISKIMDTLKRHLPFSGQEGLLELKKIAVRFEEKTYTAATSQPDYLRRISLKMLSMETKSQNNINNSMATNIVGNGKNSTESGSQCIQSQTHNNQGQPISIPGINSQSQSRQQMLAQSLQNIITSTAMQSSVGLSSALPSVCTQANLVGQNSGFGDFFPTQNISGISQNNLGNSGQGLPSSMFSSAQRQMQGRQLMQQQIVPQQQSHSQNSQQQQQFLYQQQLQHQLMRQKMQQGNIPHTLMQSHLQQQQQQQQQNLLQSNSQSLMQPSSLMQSTLQNQSSSVQHSAQSVIQQHQQSVVRQNQQVQQSPIVHQQQISASQSQQQQQMNAQQQLVGQQTNVSNLTQNQLSGQQNISEMQQLQRSTGQQNNVSSIQQAVNSQNNFSNHSQMGSQSSISGIQQQQQQQLGGVQPLNSIQSNTLSGHGLPQSKSQQQAQSNTSLMPHGQQSQVQQQLISQMQTPLQQQLSLQQQPNLMQQRLNSGNLLQSQSILEQQKQLLQTHRILQDTSTSLDSTVQSGQVIGGEWQEELYQKIKAMKDMYLTDLLEMYQKTSIKLYQPKPPQLERFKVFRSMLEHVLLFLQLPKNSITLAHKEKVASYEKQILGFLNTNKRKPISYVNQMQLQQAESQILTSQHPTSTTSMNTLPLQNTNLPLQEQMLQPQQQLKQQMQHRQMHQHLMQKQFLQQQQRKQTQPMLLNQQQQMAQFHQINDINDLKSRQQQQQQPGMGMKPGIFQQQQQQQQIVGPQRSSVFQQSMKPGSSFSTQVIQVPSSAPHLSPQVDQPSLSFSKTGTPLQVGGTGSPFVIPSPSAPLAPSPMPGDSEKPQSGISSAISNPGIVPNHPPAPSLAIGTPGISASPLLAEFTGQDVNHGNTSTAVKPGPNEQPLDRIIKVMKSMSAKALSRSISDISSVVSMVDAISGSAPGNGSRAAVGDDLVAVTRCRVQARALSASQDSNVRLKKMRRYMNAMPLNTNLYAENENHAPIQSRYPDAADFESTATSAAKNPKLEALMEEIQGINDGLIDTVLDIGEDDADYEGIVVKCSFTATALCQSLKEEYTSGKMSKIKPISLLVPFNYPNISPLLLDKPPHIEEGDISAKVLSRFNVSLRSLSQPTSLEKMAKAWDMCVRAAILEYVKPSGGGTFTSIYGDWENNDMS